MSFDKKMFIWRIIIFFVVSILFAIGSKLIGKDFSIKNLQKANKNRSTIRKILECFIVGIGVAIAIFAIYELIVGNPNSWLAMKIFFYLSVWSCLSVAMFLYYSYSDELQDWNGKADLVIRAGAAVAILSIVCFLVSTSVGSVIVDKKPITTVEHEVINRTQICPIDDENYLVDKNFINEPADVFIVSWDGQYRYYYLNENGGRKENVVDASKTTVYYIESGQPHIDKVSSYNYKTLVRNNREYKDRSEEKTWYELYVPRGSIATPGISVPN